MPARENAVNTCSGDLYVVITGQIPDDTNRSEMIGLAQMQDFFDDLRQRPVDWVFGNWLLVDQSSFTGVFIQSFPTVKASPCNTECAVCAEYRVRSGS